MLQLGLVDLELQLSISLQAGNLPGIFQVDCQAFAADMNGDGKLDIVTLDVRDGAGPGAIDVLLNKTKE